METLSVRSVILDKRSFHIAFAIYSFILLTSVFFMITFLDAYDKSGDLLFLLLVIFNSFVIGYCAMRLGKWYKKWIIYQKFGVKGTWE